MLIMRNNMARVFNMLKEEYNGYSIRYAYDMATVFDIKRNNMATVFDMLIKRNNMATVFDMLIKRNNMATVSH